MRRALVLAALAACGSDGPSTTPITFGDMGPLVGDAGKGGFRFGVATAATQIEDMNTATDWYVWTAPAPDGLGKDTFVDKAVMGYTKAVEDLQLVKQMNLDSYRLSIEWARIEPTKDHIDEAAIAHYRDVLMGLKALGIRPLVTIHHFSNPVWIADPRDNMCNSGPTDTNLCGLGSPGGQQVIQQMAEHAALLAQRFGDLVDEWGTVNEPINYLFAAYGGGIFPPGRATITALQTQFLPVVRDYIAAHAAMYDAIKANDTIDADGDGVAAAVGLSMSVQDWEPSRGNLPSQRPEDIAARDHFVYMFHYLFVDAIVNGSFDTNIDGTGDEPHPEWAGRLDWLGLQYYFRAGVTASPALLPAPVAVTPCFQGFDLGSCLETTNQSFCVPQMGYEFWADGLRGVLVEFSKRYPNLPLVVTESGLASDVGTRKAEALVRILEAIAKARDEDHVDVRGYYHWSLMDNFEWAMGFKPHFGLYHVDLATYARTPTEAVDVYGAIAASRSVTSEQRKQYGGLGPMTPETVTTDPFCSLQP